MDFFRENIFYHGLTYDFILHHNLSNKIILDIGCSTAFVGRWLQKYHKSWEYIGIDISKTAINIAKKNNINVKYGNNLKLNLPDNYADFVISEGVIHHTPNPYRCFQELIRITKKSGVISLYVYNRNHLYYFVYTLLGKPCRWLYIHPTTRRLSKRFCFALFNLFYVQLANTFFFKNKTPVPLDVSYNIYHDQILTPIAYFFTKKQIHFWAKENNLKILKEKMSINKQGLMFLFEKR